MDNNRKRKSVGKIQEIYLYDRLLNGKVSKRNNRIIKEMSGLELLIQKGIMKQGVINRLKELAEDMK